MTSPGVSSGTMNATFGKRRLAKYVVGSLAIAIAMVSVVASILIWQGGISTSGDELDLTAVSAFSAVVSAIASVVLMAALGFTALEFDRRAEELRRQEDHAAQAAKRERMSHRPYLRADIAFADHHEANFVPIVTPHVYSLEELTVPPSEAEKSELETLSAVSSGSSYDSYDLVLWVTNLQSEQLGIADSVSVEIRVWWQAHREDTELTAITLVPRIAYLGPRQTTAIRICRPLMSLDRFAAEIHSVSYSDTLGRLSNCHGAMKMVYIGGEVRNERKIQRFEP